MVEDDLAHMPDRRFRIEARQHEFAEEAAVEEGRDEDDDLVDVDLVENALRDAEAYGAAQDGRLDVVELADGLVDAPGPSMRRRVIEADLSKLLHQRKFRDVQLDPH